MKKEERSTYNERERNERQQQGLTIEPHLSIVATVLRCRTAENSEHAADRTFEPPVLLITEWTVRFNGSACNNLNETESLNSNI